MRTTAIRQSADVQGLVDEARGAESAGRFEVARHRYEAALRLLGPRERTITASAVLRWIGRTHEAEGDLHAAMDCYAVAEAAAVASRHAPDLAHVLNCRGILAFRRGMLEEAQQLYRRARTLALVAGERRLVAMVDQNLGNVASVHGDRDEALSRYDHSLRQYRRLGLTDYVGPLLTNIGRLQTSHGAWIDAETAFDEAESSIRDSANERMLVLIDVNRTRLHLSQGDLRRARRTCDDAMERSLALGEDRWLGEIHMHDGAILRQMQRPAIAEERLDRALREARRREELLLTAEIRQQMAHLFRAQHRNREVLQCLRDAHEAFQRLRARNDLAQVRSEIERLEQSFDEIVAQWGASIESKDRYTGGHCERVADFACALARAVGLDSTDLTWFRMGALLHDVGKVDVPEEILNKPGPLSDDEWATMRQHPERGVELLSGVEFPWDIRPMVLHHHERWDGGGYPYGLSGRAIPLAARVLCVADVFDALTTTRSYRRSFTHSVALEIMAGDVGHVFDPEVFDLFRGSVLPRALTRATAPGRPAIALRHARTLERRPPVQAVA